MLDDLMVTLDMDLNDKLDYRELTKGLGLWKVEKRERKQQKIADTLNSPGTAPCNISVANFSSFQFGDDSPHPDHYKY